MKSRFPGILLDSTESLGIFLETLECKSGSSITSNVPKNDTEPFAS